MINLLSSEDIGQIITKVKSLRSRCLIGLGNYANSAILVHCGFYLNIETTKHDTLKFMTKKLLWVLLGASANEFSAILFLLIAQSNSNSVTSIISTFSTNFEAKLHLNPTTGEEFPHRPPL